MAPSKVGHDVLVCHESQERDVKCRLAALNYADELHDAILPEHGIIRDNEYPRRAGHGKGDATAGAAQVYQVAASQPLLRERDDDPEPTDPGQ